MMKALCFLFVSLATQWAQADDPKGHVGSPNSESNPKRPTYFLNFNDPSYVKAGEGIFKRDKKNMGTSKLTPSEGILFFEFRMLAAKDYGENPEVYPYYRDSSRLSFFTKIAQNKSEMDLRTFKELMYQIQKSNSISDSQIKDIKNKVTENQPEEIQKRTIFFNKISSIKKEAEVDVNSKDRYISLRAKTIANRMDRILQQFDMKSTEVTQWEATLVDFISPQIESYVPTKGP